MRFLILILLLLAFPSYANACSLKAKPATAEMMQNLPPDLYGFKAKILSVRPISKKLPVDTDPHTALLLSIQESDVFTVIAKILENYGKTPDEEYFSFGYGECDVFYQKGEISYFIATTDKETGNLIISKSPEQTLKKALKTSPEDWRDIPAENSGQ